MPSSLKLRRFHAGAPLTARGEDAWRSLVNPPTAACRSLALRQGTASAVPYAAHPITPDSAARGLGRPERPVSFVNRKSPQELVLALALRCSRMAPVTMQSTTREDGPRTLALYREGSVCGHGDFYSTHRTSRMSRNSFKTKDRAHVYPSQSREPVFRRPVGRTASRGGGFIGPPPEPTEATSWIGDHSSVLEPSRLAR